jgi:hypothetical protein
MTVPVDQFREQAIAWRRSRPGPPMSKSPDRLAEHFNRGHIDGAQFAAGREFQKHFALADRRRRADLERGQPDGLAADQVAAWKWLAKCYQALGLDGSALICDVLIDGKTTKQIMAARGKAGEGWQNFYARRVREALSTLADVFGFERENRASGTRAQNIGVR